MVTLLHGIKLCTLQAVKKKFSLPQFNEIGLLDAYKQGGSNSSSHTNNQ